MKTGTIFFLLITLLIYSYQTANRSGEMEFSTAKLYAIRPPEGVDIYQREGPARNLYQYVTNPLDNIELVPAILPPSAANYEYIAQSGDTLNSVAARFAIASA